MSFKIRKEWNHSISWLFWKVRGEESILSEIFLLVLIPICLIKRLDWRNNK